MRPLLLILTSLLVFAGCDEPAEKVVYKDKIVYIEVPAEEIDENSGADAADDGEDSGTGSSADGGGADSADTEDGGDSTDTADDGAEDGSALTDGTGDPAITSVQLTGSLAIVSAESGRTFERSRNATLETYSLYCTTFEEEPRACSIAIDGNGVLNGECENFAGQSFGCFLRQNSTTLTTVDFDGDSSITAGGGEIIANVSYDAATKKASAVVDEGSTALDSAAIESAKAEVGAETTVLPSLNGDWQVACITDNDAGLSCDNKPEFAVHLNHFSPAEGPRRLGLWESETAKQMCLGDDGDESTPSFSFKLGTTTFSMNFTSAATLTASLDAAFASMIPDIKDAILNSVKWESRDQTLHCASNPVKESGCVLTTIEQIHAIDGDGKRFNELNDISSQSNSMDIKTLTCTGDTAGTSKDIPLCPPHVELSEDGYGTIKHIILADEPVFLACDTGQPHLFVHPAPETNLADSVAAFATSDECDTINAGSYTGLTKVERERARTLVMELGRQASFPDFLDASVCADVVRPNTFTDFRNCATNTDYFVCQKADQIRHDYGMIVSGSTGKLVADADAPVPAPPFESVIICPEARKGFFDGTHADIPAFGAACKAEFASLTVDEQIGRIVANSFAQDHRPILETIGCSISKDNQRDIFFDSLADLSCMPDVYFDEVCDNSGNCKRGLRCQGSSARGGACYDQYGVFVGRIFSRMDLMTIKPRVNKAFELSNTYTDSWHRPTETGESFECKFGSTSVLNARLSSNTQFDGLFQQTSFDSCHNDFSFADGDTSDASGFTKDDIRKFRFTKCGDGGCNN